MKSLSVHFRKSVAFATVDSKIHGKSIEAALSSEFGQDFSTNDMNPNFLKILIVPKNKTLSQASHFLRDATFKTLKEHLRNLVAQSKEDSLNVDDEMLKSARNFADEL